MSQFESKSFNTDKESVARIPENQTDNRFISKKRPIPTHFLSADFREKHSLNSFRGNYQINDFEIDSSAFEILSVDQAKKLALFPLGIHESRFCVLYENPEDIMKVLKVEGMLERPVEMYFASKDTVEGLLKKAEKDIDHLKNATEDFLLVENKSKLIDQDDGSELAPIVRFINTILRTALNKRASDIHIECFEYSIVVKYRIDGELYSATEDLNVDYHPAFISRLKIMADLDIAERRVPQDGRFKLSVGESEIDFRISVLPSVYGESVVIRILDQNNVSRDWSELELGSLGMTSQQLDIFRKFISEPYGMILVTGPTGSGKTTTLYAALKETNTGGGKIITIEDPVEYQLPGVVQIPVNNKKGLTFAKGLRSILRHDPDKILVGEIRDSETADIAVQSALTGHLVFSSIHANNAIDVLARMSNMGINLQNTLSALKVIIAQRLIRLLCPECKQIDSSKNKIENITFYKPSGCESCDFTGFKGREMVSEMLEITEKMRISLLDGERMFEVLSSGGLIGKQSMRDVAEIKYREGLTSWDEVSRVTGN